MPKNPKIVKEQIASVLAVSGIAIAAGLAVAALHDDNEVLLFWATGLISVIVGAAITYLFVRS